MAFSTALWNRCWLVEEAEATSVVTDRFEGVEGTEVEFIGEEAFLSSDDIH